MTPQPPPPTSVRPSALPIVALVLTILGLCLLPLLPVGLVLAIVSLVKSGDPAYASRKTLAIVALVLSLVLSPVSLLITVFLASSVGSAAIAIPAFIKTEARSKQSEAKTYLKDALIAEKSYFEEHDRFTSDVVALNFETYAGNRYLYLFAAEGPVREAGAAPAPGRVGVGPDTRRYPEADLKRYRAALPPDLAQSLGVRGTCPECAVTVVAIGNIDNDDTLDVWSISSEDRVAADGTTVPAGVPMNHINDVEE
jgi:type IV pilus assembly protein PilA